MIYTTECTAAVAAPARTPSDRAARSIASREEARNDALLVSRFNSGDEAAFIEIMTRHRDRVFSVAFNMLKNRADAEEIVQDTFIRAHRGLARFRGESSLATWLHRISMNLSRNRYWYFFRRRQQSTVSLNVELGSESNATIADLIASSNQSPASEAASNEFVDLVSACMLQLGAESRRILVLRNIKDKSYGQIAKELGVNIGTVKSRIARARHNLRLLLAQYSPEFGMKDGLLAWFDIGRNTSGTELIEA